MFIEADKTFQHNVIYDPRDGKVRPLSGMKMENEAEEPAVDPIQKSNEIEANASGETASAI